MCWMAEWRDRKELERFMATDTGNRLARHGHEPTPHQLHRLALGVQRLDRNRRVGGHAKPGGSVGFDGHGAEDTPYVPGPVQADNAQQSYVAELRDGIAGFRESQSVACPALHRANADQAAEYLFFELIEDSSMAISPQAGA